jgi:hypothetical protein
MTPTNYPSMDEALTWLDSRHIPHWKITDYQIKVGQRISWYPRTGAINLDTRTGCRPHPHRGRHALEQLIEAMRDTL